MFNNSEKVEFYSTNLYSLLSHPIEKINIAEISWCNKLKNQQQHINKITQNTFRCPGIFTPYKHGFVLKSWYDIMITASGDQLLIEYPSPDIHLNTPESIDFHDSRMLTNAFETEIIEGRKCHKKILKIHTSWFVKLPRGYQLLQTNLPLSEESRFSAVTGIYDPLINNQISIPLFWHHLDSSPTVISAGTPLCFLLPIKLSTHNVSIREATMVEHQWAIFNHKRNNTFVRNYEKMKEVARKFFNKDY